jgi:predicted solute-binding protein
MYLYKKKKLKNDFINKYFSNIQHALRNIDYKKILKISDFLEKKIKKKKNYLCCWKRWVSSYSKSFIMRLQ